VNGEAPKSVRTRWQVLAFYLLIFSASLAVRAVYAYTRPIPVSADTGYYLMVAQDLYHGRGFVSDYVWNYLAGLPDGLPVPSNGYWMPGTSLVMAGTFSLAGASSLRIAQWPSLICGALLCVIAAWIADIVSGRRAALLLAGAVAAVNYYLVELSLSPDHFMLNAALVNLSLIALWFAWRGRPILAPAAGALAAVAYLTRTDGGLLVVVAAAAAVNIWYSGERKRALGLFAGFVAAFAVVAAPWWARQTLVFGNVAGANPLRTAFLTEYNDLFRLDQSHLNLREYIQATSMLSLDGKMEVVLVSLRLLLKAVMLVALPAALAIGFPEIRRRSLPWLVYLPLGILTPSLLVPFPALRGGFWHIMPAFVPVVLALGVAGGLRLVTLSRAARPGWVRGAAWAVLSICLLSVAYWWAFPPKTAGTAGPLYPQVAAEAVRALGSDPGPALTDNAWGLYYVSGLPCAQFPTDGVEAALKVADAIGARYLITQANAPDKIPSMQGIVSHPRFAPLARYPAGDTRLLVYRILSPDAAARS
jgi:hypothetical protein